MKKKKKKGQISPKILVGLVFFGLILAVFVYQGWQIAKAKVEVIQFGSTGTIEGSYKYIADPSTNEIVTATSAILHRMLVGTNVAGGEILISDHESSASGSIVFYVTGNSLQGVYDMGAYFTNGITVTTTNQQNVTIIYDPR